MSKHHTKGKKWSLRRNTFVGVEERKKGRGKRRLWEGGSDYFNGCVFSGNPSGAGSDATVNLTSPEAPANPTNPPANALGASRVVLAAGKPGVALCRSAGGAFALPLGCFAAPPKTLTSPCQHTTKA